MSEYVDFEQDCALLQSAFDSIVRELSISEERRGLSDQELQQLKADHEYTCSEMERLHLAIRSTQADHLKDIQRLKEHERLQEQFDSLTAVKAFTEDQLKNVTFQNEQLTAQASADAESVDRLNRELNMLRDSVKELTAQKKDLMAKRLQNEETILNLTSKLSQHNPVEASLYQQKIAALEAELAILRKLPGAKQAASSSTTSSASPSKLSFAGQNLKLSTAASTPSPFSSPVALNQPFATETPASRLHRAKRGKGAGQPTPAGNVSDMFQFAEFE